MRRIALLAGLLSVMVMEPQTAQAVKALPVRSPVGHTLRVTVSSGPRRLPAANRRPQRRVDSLGPDRFRFPLSVFPAGFSLNDSLAVDSRTADEAFPFGALHDTYLHIPYRNEGIVGGWYARAGKKLEHGTFSAAYLASYYQNSDQAATVLINMAASMSRFAAPTICSFGEECIQVAFSYNTAAGDPYSGVYRIIKVGSTVLEAEFDIDNKDYSSQRGQGSPFLDAVSRAYLTVLGTAPPTPTSLPTVPPATALPATVIPPPARPQVRYRILSVRVEKDQSQPDYRLVRTPLSRIRSGSQVYLSIYFRIDAAPARANLRARWTVKSNRHVLLNTTAAEKLPTDATGTYRLPLTVRLIGKGIFVIRGQISLGKLVAHGTAVVQLTNKR